MSTSAALVMVYAKEPVPGRVKTRLAKGLGPEEAARYAEAFIGDTLDHLRQLGLEFWLLGDQDPADAPILRALLGPDEAYLRQSSGDLGERLLRGFEAAFARSAEVVIALGADTPHLPGSLIREGITTGLGGDIAVGPTHDGGYYLLAIPRSQQDALEHLFEDVPWGGDGVFGRTREILDSRSLPWKELPGFWDIDHPSDLLELRGTCLGSAPDTGEMAGLLSRTRVLLGERWDA